MKKNVERRIDKRMNEKPLSKTFLDVISLLQIIIIMNEIAKLVHLFWIQYNHESIVPTMWNVQFHIVDTYLLCGMSRSYCIKLLKCDLLG